MKNEMTSNKPYLVKAFYDWISDNGLTPYIVVDVSVYGVLVPQAFVSNEQIVLNVSASAVGSISLSDKTIEFSARFGGKLEFITVPYGAIAAIYAKENGAGTSLPIEHTESELKDENQLKADTNKPSIASVKSDTTTTSPSSEESNGKPIETTKKKPSLKVIK